MKTAFEEDSSRGGMLVMVMAVLLGMSLIGAALLRQAMVNGIEVSTEAGKAKAFWIADAGIEEARAIAYKNFINGETAIFPSSQPRTWSGSLSFGEYTVNITEGSGLDGVYTVVSEGLSDGGDKRILSLGISQEPALVAGMFGNESLTLQPRIAIYSYNSASNPVPTPSDSTGEVLVGSNEDVSIKESVILDGSLLLGEDTNGVLATYTGSDDILSEYTGRINPDPLGIRGGIYEGFLNDAITVNNNASVPQISATAWLVPNNATSTLAAGVYFVTSIEIRGTVSIDTSGGLVEVYLTGPMKAWPGSRIGTSGSASRFRIYSNSASPVDLQPDGDCAMFLYAPYSAEVKIRPGNNFYGSCWGENVKLLPGGDVYIDVRLMEHDAFSIYRIAFGKWRQIE